MDVTCGGGRRKSYLELSKETLLIKAELKRD
jgi:hypothetical protein